MPFHCEEVLGKNKCHCFQKKGSVIMKIGSRDSELAMKQTSMIKEQLQSVHPDIVFEIESMKTLGDKILDVSLSKIGSKALFTKELETALEDGHVDFVVHSLKDLPTTLPDGLAIGAVCSRENPSDAVIMHPKHGRCTLKDLPDQAVIGTSSLRRIAQLKRRYPHLKFENIRGNLNTRLRKLEHDNQYDAIVLAAAGIIRMGWKDKIAEYISDDDCMYAVGQGAIAVECRDGDKFTLEVLCCLIHPETLICVASERALMKSLEGGCSVPLAVNCKIVNSEVNLEGGVWSLDGSEEIIESSKCVIPMNDILATECPNNAISSSDSKCPMNDNSTNKLECPMNYNLTNKSECPMKDILSNKSECPMNDNLTNKSECPMKDILSNKSECPMNDNLINKSECPMKDILSNKSECLMNDNLTNKSECPMKDILSKKSECPMNDNLTNKSECPMKDILSNKSECPMNDNLINKSECPMKDILSIKSECLINDILTNEAKCLVNDILTNKSECTINNGLTDKSECPMKNLWKGKKTKLKGEKPQNGKVTNGKESSDMINVGESIICINGLEGDEIDCTNRVKEDRRKYENTAEVEERKGNDEEGDGEKCGNVIKDEPKCYVTKRDGFSEKRKLNSKDLYFEEKCDKVLNEASLKKIKICDKTPYETDAKLSANVGSLHKIMNGTMSDLKNICSQAESLEDIESNNSIKNVNSSESVDFKFSTNGMSTNCDRKESLLYCGIHVPTHLKEQVKKSYELGIDLADKLLNKGAKRILDEAKAANLIPANVHPSKVATQVP